VALDVGGRVSYSCHSDGDATLYVGDCREVLAGLPEGSARTCVTSPPYWGLRDYGHPDQLGAERTPDEYVANLVEVFREVRRVLRPDGTLWLNLGDSYINAKGAAHGVDPKQGARRFGVRVVDMPPPPGLKRKDLVGMPWRVAFALQADGWWLRSDIIWAKPNAMPESVTDRPTKAHEYVFLLAKSERYFYDADAVKEAAKKGHAGSKFHTGKTAEHQLRRASDKPRKDDGNRNARSVWSIATQPSGIEHFAMMPPELAQRCILAGSARGDTVLDPFSGAGTTGLVAMEHGRRYLGVELNPRYADLSVERWSRVQRTLFAAGAGR